MTPTLTTYSTDEIVEATGATVKQIQHWQRLSVLVPSGRRGVGSGHYHRWTDDDIRAARVLAWLAADSEPGGRGWMSTRHAHRVARLAQLHNSGYLAITATVRWSPSLDRTLIADRGVTSLICLDDA